MFWINLLFPTQSSAALNSLKEKGNYLPSGKVQRLRGLESSTSIFVAEIYLEKPWVLKFVNERTKLMKICGTSLKSFLKKFHCRL